MIHNEHERRITKRKHTELIATLETRKVSGVPASRNAEMHALVGAGIQSEADELKSELDDYDNLVAGKDVVDVDAVRLSDLGEQLIRARIAAGLSQQQLADLVGLAEGVIRRYERERYANTSLKRLEVIAIQLHEESRKHLSTSLENAS